MFKFPGFIFLSLLSFITFANKNNFYQVDLIVFTQENAFNSQESSLLSAKNPIKNARPLQEQSAKISPYHLLPFSFSQLKEEYWALKRRPQYRVLINYSWLQPLNNMETISIPKVLRENWQVEGSIQIKRSNYYSVSTNLMLTNPAGVHFSLEQRQRLNGGDIYYFDNPKAGLLIKVHQIT